MFITYVNQIVSATYTSLFMKVGLSNHIRLICPRGCASAGRGEVSKQRYTTIDVSILHVVRGRMALSYWLL